MIQGASADPFLFYTLVAAGFLAVVSLGSGFVRSDFLAVVRPQGLLHVSLAVLAAFLVVLLADALQPRLEIGADGLWLETLRGLSRFPLYVVTLAYGPSAGLLAAGLFAAFATNSTLPGLPEAVLALELVVLGWFALAPSPRTSGWAGPFDALLAYFLTWSTGGAALLQASSGNGTLLAAHLAYHQNTALGIALSMTLLFLVTPGAYKRFFPHSRIAPRPPLPSLNGFGPTQERRVAPRGRRATDRVASGTSEARGRRKEDATLETPVLETEVDSPSSLESHADAELVAPRDGSAPGLAAPALRDAPHDVKP